MEERAEFLEAVLAKTRDFHHVPMISPFSDGKWYFTAKKLKWTASGEHAGKYPDIIVPKGFITDLASVPRPFWALLPRDGVYLAAAIVHDYNYWVQDITREDSDEIFNIGMRELKVSTTQRVLIYNAVKVAGGLAWSGNTKLKSKGEKRVLEKLPKKPITLKDWRLEIDT